MSVHADHWTCAVSKRERLPARFKPVRLRCPQYDPVVTQNLAVCFLRPSDLERGFPWRAIAAAAVTSLRKDCCVARRKRTVSGVSTVVSQSRATRWRLCQERTRASRTLLSLNTKI